MSEIRWSQNKGFEAFEWPRFTEAWNKVCNFEQLHYEKVGGYSTGLEVWQFPNGKFAENPYPFLLWTENMFGAYVIHFTDHAELIAFGHSQFPVLKSLLDAAWGR